MLRILLCAASASMVLLFTACKSDNKAPSAPAVQHASPQVMGGHWIAMDFCRRANQYQSVVRAMDAAPVPAMFSLTFTTIKADSVACYNGFEEWFLPVKYRLDTLEVANAVQGQPVYLVYNSGGEKNMQFFGRENNSFYIHDFIKSSANTATGRLAFHTALNANLFTGSFKLLGGKAQEGQILFTPGGFITGFEPFDRYEVCVGGDCFVTEASMDIMTLRNAQKQDSEQRFAWSYNTAGDTLTLYKLRNTNPSEKAAYVTDGVAYRFSRIKPN